MTDEVFADEDLISEGDTKEIAMKAYRATYRRQDTTTTEKYFQGERFIDAAKKASDMVEGDPFTTLTALAELGPLQ